MLFPPQQTVLDHGMLDLGFSTVLSLATGSGKTTLAEMAMDWALAHGERVAYLTPLKALAEEKIFSWRDRWPGRKVGIFTGDYESSRVPVSYRDAEVLICTYERLDGVLRHWQRHLGWLAELGLVVVDEFHLLGDPSRGPRLEGAISRLRRVNPFCRVMGLSATISSHSDLAAWLDGVSYHSTWRLVPLEHEIRRFKRLADKPALVAEIVAETAEEGGQTLVFAASRRRAELLAAQVSSAGYATVHHHAGLGLERRRIIESQFRAGSLTCLVATPTLEMGLNLPCRIVVIADNTRWNGETFAPLPVWNYLQRAGRAGRPGQDGSGRAILLAPTDFDLLLHHCWDADLQPKLPLSIEVVESLEELIQPIPSYLLDRAPPVSLSPRTCSTGVLMATLAWQSIQGNDPEPMCERLDIYPSDAQLLRQSLVRLLKASADVLAALDPLDDPIEKRQREQLCGPSLTSRLRRLALQLECGLPAEAVHLARIPGYGGRLAWSLVEAGIPDLEDLCTWDPSDLAKIPGIGPKRARAWIAAAGELVKDYDPIQIPAAPKASRVMPVPPDWPGDIDPGRLRRAATLEVSAGGDGNWVSGGAEEHQVRGDVCDCADFSQHGAGWWCKHRLAVRLASPDRMLSSLVARLNDLRPPPMLAGHLADLTLGRRWEHG